MEEQIKDINRLDQQEITSKNNIKIFYVIFILLMLGVFGIGFILGKQTQQKVTTTHVFITPTSIQNYPPTTQYVNPSLQPTQYVSPNDGQSCGTFASHGDNTLQGDLAGGRSCIVNAFHQCSDASITLIYNGEDFSETHQIYIKRNLSGRLGGQACFVTDDYATQGLTGKSSHEYSCQGISSNDTMVTINCEGENSITF